MRGASGLVCALSDGFDMAKEKQLPEGARPGTFYVYGLGDPRTSRIYYVGVSANPKDRLHAHIVRPLASLKNWIDALDAVGQRPTLKILETVPEDEDAFVCEHRWIDKLFREGEPLVNVVGRKVWQPSRRATNAGQIAERFKVLRKQLNINQSELGRRAGLCGATICTMESGRRGDTYSIESVAGIAIALGCSIDYLVWGGERPKLDLEKLPPVKHDGRVRITNDFARCVYEKLGALRMRPKDLADRLSVSRQAVNQWLDGKRSPSVRTITKIADALGCRPDELVVACVTELKEQPAPELPAETEQPESVGEQIRWLRRSQGKSPEDVAKATGLSVASILNVEADRTRSPHARTLRLLGKALKFRVIGPFFQLVAAE